MNNIPLLDPFSSAPCHFNFDGTIQSEITMVAKKVFDYLKNNWHTTLPLLAGVCAIGAFFPKITIVALIALSSVFYSDSNSSDVKLLKTLQNKNFNLTNDEKREILLIKKMAKPFSLWYAKLVWNDTIPNNLPKEGTLGYSQFLQTMAWGEKLRELLENFETKHPNVDENIKGVFSKIKSNLDIEIPLFGSYILTHDTKMDRTLFFQGTTRHMDEIVEKIDLIGDWFQN